MIDIHNNFNQSTLDHWGYTVYSNGTLSNGTDCYLTFNEFVPILYPNGTVYNGTDCDTPYYPVKARGGLGVAWAVIMILTLVLTLFNLRKHGQAFTEEKKRFKRLGRKWQWYWLIVLQAVSALAGFFSIDLDRDYIQGSSLTAYGALYCATLPIALAACWELTRHWGAFEERKIYDEDPFRFRPDDRRSRVHLIMPLVFYLFAFLTFFMTVLRNWSNIKTANAEHAIDGRWKAGGFFAIIAWLQIIAQIVVTRLYYKVPRVPMIIVCVLICVAALVAFNMTFMWSGTRYSPFNVHSSVPFVVLLGYLPIVLMVVFMNLSGLARENEDKVILSLRRERDRANTAALMEQAKRIERERKGSVLEEQVTEVATTSTASTSEELFQPEDESKPSTFFKFFGSAPIRGKSWLSHNLKYLPFANRKNKKKKKKKEAVVLPPAKPRPPPRDIREGWKVKTASGV
ncbi:hypothetical protein TRVA0_040S01156 [Trichomonascus vanleenenianus]|uniref:DUF2434 domain-containing protein n=1 Tax=Trichomonascus vanleenenianus TaxID=2268995 RepID=UPI003ECB1360